jgi:arginase
VTSITEDQKEDSVILTAGGDHSIATGTIHGLLHKYKDLKVIWVDAHPDFIDCSMSEYEGYHGMPLSHLVGVNDKHLEGFKWLLNRLPPENVVLIGIREIDEDEWISLKKYNIKCFTPDHVDMWGIGKVVDMAIEYLDPSKGENHISAPFHISFDIDAMDPHIAEGTGTKFRGGLTHREGCFIVRSVSHQRRLVSMDLVEINPSLESTAPRKAFRDEEIYGEVTPTVGLGIDLVTSIFTKYLTL